MNGSLYLQIFLLVDVFIMGALSVTALRHLYAHFRPQHHEDAPKEHVRQPGAHLPTVIRERLLVKAETDFQKVLDRSAEELKHDLTTTSSQLSKKLERLGTEIIGDEMRRYHQDLEQLRQQADTAMSNLQAQVDAHQGELTKKLADRQAELEAKVAEEVKAEKELMMQNIDTRLADAVMSFLTETLQHDVDLGAQSKYLVSMLEEHKNDIKKGVSDEV